MTGLPLDPMFSAQKIQWLLDRVDPGRILSATDQLAVGTVDPWLVYCLTNEHRIETGDASRTQLLNLETADWDPELLELSQIPFQCLPRIAASNESSDPIRGVSALPAATRIYEILGDSHAALYAHGIRLSDQVKATFGTGSSIMGFISPGAHAHIDREGLVRTITQADPEAAYAFEGTILFTGATPLWLAQFLGLELEQLNDLAQRAPTSQWVD